MGRFRAFAGRVLERQRDVRRPGAFSARRTDPGRAQGPLSKVREGRLFAGPLTIAPRCGVCRLDYGFADAGDGPAVFAILIIGFVVVGLALWMEVNVAPPLWVHFMLWIPLAIVLSLIALRLIKGVLVTLQYANKAAEGHLDSPQ